MLKICLALFRLTSALILIRLRLFGSAANEAISLIYSSYVVGRQSHAAALQCTNLYAGDWDTTLVTSTPWCKLSGRVISWMELISLMRSGVSVSIETPM